MPRRHELELGVASVNHHDIDVAFTSEAQRGAGSDRDDIDTQAGLAFEHGDETLEESGVPRAGRGAKRRRESSADESPCPQPDTMTARRSNKENLDACSSGGRRFRSPSPRRTPRCPGRIPRPAGEAGWRPPGRGPGPDDHHVEFHGLALGRRRGRLVHGQRSRAGRATLPGVRARPGSVRRSTPRMLPPPRRPGG